MHAHPQLNFRVHFQSLRDLNRALCRILRMGEKDQHHAVPGRNAKKLSAPVRALKLLCATDDVIEFAKILALLVDHELGITDDVRAQDVRDLKFRLWLDRRGHVRGAGIQVDNSNSAGRRRGQRWKAQRKSRTGRMTKASGEKNLPKAESLRRIVSIPVALTGTIVSQNKCE